MSDNGAEPKEEQSSFTSTWTIEWKDKSSHVVNTQKETTYSQALSLFNELSRSGKEVVLYEIRTPIGDPSAQAKKIPLLNSAKAKKTSSRVEPKSRATGMQDRITSASRSARTSLKDLRTRILILIAVIAVFVIILFLISILFTSSDFAHHFSIFTLSIESSTSRVG